MAANPDMAFTPDWLCCQFYATSRVEKKHRVSVRRPIHRITDDDLDWAIYCIGVAGAFLDPSG